MKKKLLIIAVVLILLFLLTWRFSLVEHADPLPDWAARGMDRITGGRAYAEAEGLART